MDNLRHDNQLRKPPASALKQINGGRMNGKTDINPQWRYEAMTQVFGPVGIGWTYEIVKLWLEPNGEQVAAFSEVRVKVKDGEQWSEWVPGIGGSMFVAKEKAGPYLSDECYKMATTDALSVALKVFGVAGDIYAGLWDGSKYKDQPAADTKPAPKTAPKAPPAEIIEAPAAEYEDRWGEYPLPAKISKPEKGQLQMLTMDEYDKLEAWSKKHPEYVQLAIAISHYTLPF
jgi:hypothetical protein